MRRIIVLDYGAGNILSISRAIEYCGSQAVLTKDPSVLKDASAVILPGVGAFADGMTGLRECGLIEPLTLYAQSGRPLLGVCLGMQMLFDESDEFGLYRGLGLIPGRVQAIPPTDSDEKPHKIPHIGWNKLFFCGNPWEGTILDGIKTMDTVYFVHSFTAIPKNNAHRLADSYYNGRLISAAVCSGAIYGTQFHPEKSGEVGLRILKNFLNLPQYTGT